MGILRTILGKDTTTDILDLLKAQHAEVDALIAQLEARQGDPQAAFLELANKLAAHAAAEEKVFYPAVVTKETRELLEESVEEHLAVKRVLADMITMTLDDGAFHAKLSVLKEQVSHHAHSEEEGKLFPKLRISLSADQRAALGNEYLVAFEELMDAQPYKQVARETRQAAPLPRA
ncbi:MAG TPA: hemerythrin domain-containing protein [Kofleriaceae bacterium]|nr:hemerythrin domain-containing protein [Kofleriaceae bacterium]